MEGAAGMPVRGVTTRPSPVKYGKAALQLAVCWRNEQYSVKATTHSTHRF